MSDEIFKIDNKNFIRNIRFWLDVCGQNIGDFETNELKMSRGYISRIEKSPNLFPEIDVLLHVAQIMNVTVDFLIKEDLSTIGDNTKLIHNLICKLKKDTLEGKLEWKKDGNCYIFYDGIEYYRENVNSEFKAYVSDSPCYAEYSNGKMVCLQPLLLKRKTKNRKKIEKLEYELSIGDSHAGDMINKNVICYSDVIMDTIATELNELALIIVNKFSDVELDSKTTSSINDILNL